MITRAVQLIRRSEDQRGREPIRAFQKVPLQRTVKSTLARSVRVSIRSVGRELIAGRGITIVPRVSGFRFLEYPLATNEQELEVTEQALGDLIAKGS